MPNESSRHPLLDFDPRRPSEGSDTPHILLVEDDDPMRSMIAQALRQQGYEVTECPDAFHWMDFCIGQRVNDESIRYDLVISDIRMPGMNSLDLLEGLRSSHRHPPTILITAFRDKETHERAADLGAVHVLDKPFAMQELLHVVREHCQTASADDAPGSGREDRQLDDEPPA